MYRSTTRNFRLFYIRCYSSSTSSKTTTTSDCVANLEKLFKNYHKPNFYETLENKNIKLLKRASVLVPLSYNSTTNEYDFTLTKRTDHLRNHKGQVCYVGGMKDETDENELVTAYREAKEEIGLEEKSLKFLAQLIPICTASGVLVTPIVAFLDKSEFTPKINKNEVDFMFELPTRRFLEKQNHRSKQVGLQEKFFVHYFHDHVNERLINTWGLTAMLSVCVSSIVNRKLPEFDLDPSSKLTETNLNEFLEHYLVVKSKSLVTAYATKSRVTDTIKSFF